MKTSKTAYSNPVKCVVCPAGCRSFSYFPGCNPDNPCNPFNPTMQTVNPAIDDFFGQFIKTQKIISLFLAEITRFLEFRILRCPECYIEELPINPTSDGYLICSRCNIHWDLLPGRLKTQHVNKSVDTLSNLLPNGKLKKRHYLATPEIDLHPSLLDPPF